VSLHAVAEAVGDVEEVHFVLFGMPTFTAYIDVSKRLFGAPIVEEDEEGEGEEEEQQPSGGGSAGPTGSQQELR
jgi:hypothetical protein